MKILTKDIIGALECLSKNDFYALEEIRLGINKPIIIYLGNEEYFLSNKGKTLDKTSAIVITKQDIIDILSLASNHSMFLFEEQIKQGFITASGGIRIGICGSGVYERDGLTCINNINYLNIRMPRQIIGCANKVQEALINKNGRVNNTLIISPPKKGKTTLLRDIARVLSDVYKLKVAIIDERSEIGGNGNFDIGLRCCVLDGVKKIDGMMMAIRSISPDVIIVDEIGSNEEYENIKRCQTCGVSVIASVHSDRILENFCFETYILIDENRELVIKRRNNK